MTQENWYLTPSQAFFILKFPAVFLWAALIVGFFSNWSIVYVTIKNNQLRSPCNILIATQAVCDIVITFGHIIFFFLLYSSTLISFSWCYFYQYIPSSAMNITTALMLAIGVDRFLCLKYAVEYKNWPRKIYTSMLILSCFVYDALVKMVGYLTLTEDPAICLICDAYVGFGKDFWVFTGVIINVCVIIVYRMIANIMKHMEDSKAETKKILGSLYTIVVFYIFGCLMTMFLLVILRVLTTEPMLVVTVELFTGFFANLNMTIPAFIYYFRSSIYRSAYKKCFHSQMITVVPSHSTTLRQSRSTDNYGVGHG